jgi:hypothetical protein
MGSVYACGARLIEEDGAVGLEGLPVQAGAEDDQRRQRPAAVEAQRLCSSSSSSIRASASISR